MGGKRTNLMLDKTICDSVDEEREILAPKESRSRFYDTAAKDRVRKIRHKRARNG